MSRPTVDALTLVAAKMASSAPSRRAAASLLASLRAATPATRCPNPAVPSTRTGQRGVDRGGFASWASTPSPATWMTSRVKELKDAARAQMDAARVAPERLKSAARESVRRRLASALGPRAAESIVSGTLSLNPATHARNLTLRARAFGFRHRAPIVAVAGTGATYATYGAAIATAERLRGRGDDDAQKRGMDATAKLATLALSAGCVALTATYLRARSVVNPERVHAAVMRRLERHPGLVEVLGAPVVSSEHRAIVTTGGVWTKRGWTRLWGLGPPRFRDAKVHMAFRVFGTRKAGLVTVEAVKRKAWGGGSLSSWGREFVGNDPHEYALVAVDVAADNGDEHRVYLAGGSARYAKQGEVTGMYMREALVSVASEAYEAEQRGEEAEEDARSRADAAPKPLDEGGGMWPAERVTDYVAQKRHEVARFVTELGVADARK